DEGDDDLRHGADEALDLQDVEASPFGLDPALVDDGDRVVAGRVAGVLVPGAAADALVATGAEGPALGGRAAALPRGRPVAGEQDDADVRGAAGVVEGAVQLGDRVRAGGVEDLRPVEGEQHGGADRGPPGGEGGAG